MSHDNIRIEVTQLELSGTGHRYSLHAYDSDTGKKLFAAGILKTIYPKSIEILSFERCPDFSLEIDDDQAREIIMDYVAALE